MHGVVEVSSTSNQSAYSVILGLGHTVLYTDLVGGPFLYYVRVKGWVGGIAKYLLFLTGVGGWFWITLT